MSDTDDVKATRAAFIEKVGYVAQGEGLPRIAGRVFGLLLFDGVERSFGDLSEELQVSRGSVSTSVRLLEDRGLIKRVGHTGNRQDFFKLADNPYVSLLNGARKRAEIACGEIEASVSTLPPDASDIRERLSSYVQFYRSIENGLDFALTELTQVPASSGRRSMK